MHGRSEIISLPRPTMSGMRFTKTLSALNVGNESKISALPRLTSCGAPILPRRMSGHRGAFCGPSEKSVRAKYNSWAASWGTRRRAAPWSKPLLARKICRNGKMAGMRAGRKWYCKCSARRPRRGWNISAYFVINKRQRKSAIDRLKEGHYRKAWASSACRGDNIAAKSSGEYRISIAPRTSSKRMKVLIEAG